MELAGEDALPVEFRVLLNQMSLNLNCSISCCCCGVVVFQAERTCCRKIYFKVCLFVFVILSLAVSGRPEEKPARGGFELTRPHWREALGSSGRAGPRHGPIGR